MAREPQAVIERLLARVSINEVTGCWEWQGALHSHGYIKPRQVRRIRDRSRWKHVP
jgi:hypothetical protein